MRCLKSRCGFLKSLAKSAIVLRVVFFSFQYFPNIAGQVLKHCSFGAIGSLHLGEFRV